MYPIIYCYRKDWNDQIASHQSDGLHPPHALQALRLTSIKSYKYLNEVMPYVVKYCSFLTKTWKFQTRRLEITEVGFSFSEEPVSTEEPISASKNLADALYVLHLAVHTSSRLIEVLQQKLSEGENDASMEQHWQKWWDLKMDFINVSKMLDKILQHYKHQNDRDLPEIKKMYKIMDKITKLIKKQKKDRIQKMLGNGFILTKDEIIVSALGLSSNVANLLSGIKPEFRDHQTDEYYLREIVSQRFEDNSPLLDGDVCETLVKSGFTNARASHLSDLIEKNDPCHHQSVAYWAERYIEFMFEYDIFLNDAYPTFPNEENILHEWMTIPTEREEDGDDDYDEGIVKILSIPYINTTRDRVGTIPFKGVQFPPHEIQEGYWYHGTDHNAAESIRLNGIRLEEGNEGQDFSDSYGFYLTPYFDYAVKWAGMSWRENKGAVIVFRHSIDGSKHNGIDTNLDEDDALWTNIVRYNRSERNAQYFKCPKKLKKKLEGTDFIEGTMSGDGTHIDYINPSWRPTKKGDSDSVQLCIQSQKLADEFSDMIVGIIFFCQSALVS